MPGEQASRGDGLFRAASAINRDAATSRSALSTVVSPNTRSEVVRDRPFALQLIGFYSRATLEDFIAQSPLPGRVYLLEERFRGRPWFVLIHSLHGGQGAARQAGQALAGQLGSLDVWIRELPLGTELEVVETASLRHTP
jgi:DamX protein